jgi:hypothetical protein
MMSGLMPLHHAATWDALSNQDRRRAALVGLVVVGMRLGLWLVPYRILRRMVEVSPRRRSERFGAEPPAWIARNIVAIAGYIPQATCLTQALSAYLLLRREGFDPRLELGVARDAGTFKAHAWVICNEQVIVGDFSGGSISYRSLNSLAPPAAPADAATTDHTSTAAAAGGSPRT